MASSRILAFSSSRVGNSGYLEAAAPIIKKFLGDAILDIAFIPFASVGSYDEYFENVSKALAGLNYNIQLVLPDNAKAVLAKCGVIMVGGGNTFKLLDEIYRCQILDVIRDKVNKGTPYIGWSAGANITGPTIGTTNDMPIVEPKSFNALGMFPFQINPHYFNQPIVGHNGETRDQRLTEFIIMNPGNPIVCLPEGTALLFDAGNLKLIGETSAILLQQEEPSDAIVRKEILVGDDLSFLL